MSGQVHAEGLDFIPFASRREAEDGWVLFPLHTHLPPWAVTPFDLKKVNRVRPALKKN